MKQYNVIIVYSEDESKILMCKRTKEPYKGLYNLVGGKVEKGEDYLTAAYRELQEETGITSLDIKLTELMKFQYTIPDMELQVYLGRLNKEVYLIEEVNKLNWTDSSSNFFDINTFAGEGNIGHMLEQVKIYKDKLAY